MGGNSSYSEDLRKVPLDKRSHTDTNMRIGGHKILLQVKNMKQNKNILYSNSDNPIYLIAKADDGGIVQVSTLNVFKNHEISLEINLEFDDKGDFIPYSDSKAKMKTSHSHLWYKNSKGEFGRKRHDKGNMFDIPSEYQDLIDKIVEFNKKKNIWKK